MKYPGNINPGERFHHLVADKCVGKNNHGKALWVFLCDCGKIVTRMASNVKRGNTQSCGCFKLVVCKTHGMRKSSEYNIWIKIKDRCFNEKNPDYRHYGGRGITMCDEWCHDFAAFYVDMGPRPSKDHSIDRIDVNGSYCKVNCRWATWGEQQANRRNNVWLWYKGREMLQAHIIKEMGINADTFRKWLKCDLTPDEISVYHYSGKWWHQNAIVPCVFNVEFNGDFSNLIPHDDYVVVSRTVHADNDVRYKLIAKGNPEDYTYLLQM